MNREEGFASLLVTGLVSVLVTVALAATWVGGVVEAAHRAAAAADLAALAGAQALQRATDPCQAASATAAANDGRVVVCEVDGEVVTVVVRTQVAPVAGVRVVPGLQRRARAGPAGPRDG